MLVSLPNGKVINITIDQYLAMEEDDFKELVAAGCGSIASSPWCSSAIKKPGKVRISDEDPDPEITEGLTEDELELDEDIQNETDIQSPDIPEEED